MERGLTVAKQEGNSGKERSLGAVRNAEGVENIGEEGVPSGWEKQAPLGNLEMGEGSLEAQAQGQCS